MSVDELKHHFRIVDQTLSMHCALRDRYERRSLWMDIIQLVASTVLVAAVFIDPSILAFWHVSAKAGQTAIGVSSVVLFALSLVVLRVDWKRQAERFDRSAESLAELKAACRSLLQEDSEPDTVHVDDLCQECRRILATLPSVPEKCFAELKAHHKRKVLISKMIDEHPGASVLLMKAILCLRSNWNLLRRKSKQTDAEGENR